MASIIAIAFVGFLRLAKPINIPINTRTLPNALRIKSYGTNINLLSMKNYCNTQRSKVKHSQWCCCRVFDNGNSKYSANLCKDSVECSKEQKLLCQYQLMKNDCNTQWSKTITVTVAVVDFSTIAKQINMPNKACTQQNALRIKSYGTNINSFFVKNLKCRVVKIWWTHFESRKREKVFWELI